VEFEMPATLHATYVCQPTVSRSADFTLDPGPAVVHSVSIRVRGETHVRQWFCDLDPPFDLPVSLVAFVPDPVTGGGWYTYGATSYETGPFDITLKFVPYWPAHFGQPTWDFLLGGHGSVELYGDGAPIIDICWPIGELSDATVTGVSLVIDGEFAVPVESVTWGRIKSLFSE
jgi:hypothetical protein